MKERVMVDSNGRKYITTEPELKNYFNPDWDVMVVMVEEQQRMAKCIKELEAALAQSKSEPVCDKDPRGCWSVRCQLAKVCKNTTPPQREWVGLKDEEYFILQMKIKTPMVSVGDYIDAMRMVEEKLKEKNGF